MASELTFESLEDEVRFLRALVSVQRMADEILEDCLARQLGLSAALDVFLSQCGRMIHANSGFVQLWGTQEAVLTRRWGSELFSIQPHVRKKGAVDLGAGRILFVDQLTLGLLNLGSVGFVLQGSLETSKAQLEALVHAIAEMLDSTVLSFLALSEGHNPLERLDELSGKAGFRPRAKVGKYELVQPLGTGGMAQVMVARASNPAGVSRLVALKRMLPHLTVDPALVEQFLDEARLGLRLSHPNLVTFYDFGRAANGDYFFTMELVRGVDLDMLIYSPGGMPELPMVSAVLCQALKGLHAAHELCGEDGRALGLVHRDLSPHNVMVGFDGRVKVLDFGVAKIRTSRTVTLPGVVKGKPLYMSPEQAAGERLDRRSDLFSLGLILYEALTGTRAFDMKNDTRTMEAIVNDPLARPPALATEHWELIEACLKKRPEERFLNALQLEGRLREIIAPATEGELGNFVSERFAQRAQEFQRWESQGKR